MNEQDSPIAGAMTPEEVKAEITKRIEHCLDAEKLWVGITESMDGLCTVGELRAALTQLATLTADRDSWRRAAEQLERDKVELAGERERMRTDIGVHFRRIDELEQYVVQKKAKLESAVKEIATLTESLRVASLEVDMTRRAEHILREALEKQRVRMNGFIVGAGCNPLRAIEEINDALERSMDELRGASEEGLRQTVATESTPDGVSVDPATQLLLDRIASLEAGQQQQLMLHKAECAGLESEVSRLNSLKRKLVDANYDLQRELTTRTAEWDEANRWALWAASKNHEDVERLTAQLALSDSTARGLVEENKKLAEDLNSATWQKLMDLGQRILDRWFPEEIFTGVSGDAGPAYIVALREALKRVSALPPDIKAVKLDQQIAQLQRELAQANTREHMRAAETNCALEEIEILRKSYGEAKERERWCPIAELHEDDGPCVLMDIDDPGHLEIGSNLDLDFDESEWTHFVPVPPLSIEEARQLKLAMKAPEHPLAKDQ